ncbi:RES domain-containing protein [Variovorax sp. PDNC026]|uniref:RES domain-containing protein n=1 Tax=Variovorax sp. PDNC026 TaxID=2811425 RepID=UPI001966661B|nr:RES domain-containing protein [Variovorax sp. PDNC026]QRY32356.1 RES domain-containing protein [Variovorax sp. PDNC026]
MTYLCLQCLPDPHLRQRMATDNASPGECDFCEAEAQVVSIEDIALECHLVLRTHFRRSDRVPAVWLHDRTPAGSDLTATLASLNAVPTDALDELARAVTEAGFDRDTFSSWYETDPHEDDDPWFERRTDTEGPMSSSWKRAEASLRTESRYVNPMAMDMLNSVFLNIADDRTKMDEPVIMEAGPGTGRTELFRARVFSTSEDLENAMKHPERFLGTPPAGLGRAGRMNAKGQPVFYGATAAEIAIAEVRPPVGSWVVVAAFEITRPLQLLHLSRLRGLKLDETLSLFDPKSVTGAQRRDFLRVLSEQMVMPVMPDLEEREYLLTQVISDYLATHPATSLDGIIYPSAQLGPNMQSEVSGNVVLFAKSSFVRNADAGRNTASFSLWEYEEDGPGKYPNPEIQITKGPSKVDCASDARPESLALLYDQIKIHQVKGVQYQTWSDEVTVWTPSTTSASDL